MTKGSATKRDERLLRIGNLTTEILKEVHAYQDDFNNDGFIHSIDEYSTSLNGAILTSRSILQAVAKGVVESQDDPGWIPAVGRFDVDAPRAAGRLRREDMQVVVEHFLDPNARGQEQL